MIPHSQAIHIWYKVWAEPFIKDTLRNMRGQSDKHLLRELSAILVYFQRLEKSGTAPDKKYFEHVSQIFFGIAPFLPTTLSTRLFDTAWRDNLIQLRDYFSQMKTYTPLNIKTGRKYFVWLHIWCGKYAGNKFEQYCHFSLITFFRHILFAVIMR